MKGASKVVWIVASLVLMVIILVIFVPMLLKGGSWGFDTIIKMIDDWLNPATPEENLLIKAMTCAYYRCIEGCNSGRVKISWEDEYGEKVSCVRDFCKSDWRDEEGKICGDVAKENPVRIYLESEVEVREDHWRTMFGYLELEKVLSNTPAPFLKQESCIAPGIVWSQLVVSPSPVITVWPTRSAVLVLPDDDNIYCKEKKWQDKYTRHGDVWHAMLEYCELPEGDYSIWSGKGPGISGIIDYEDIVICSSE